MIEISDMVLDRMSPRELGQLLLNTDNYDDIEYVKKIIGYGADLEYRSIIFEWTVLHVAVFFGNVEICRVLVEAGADVDAQDHHCWTPLHRAAEFGNVEICRVLVGFGAQVDIQDREGRTALDYAKRFGLVEVVEYLEGLGND